MKYLFILAFTLLLCPVFLTAQDLYSISIRIYDRAPSVSLRTYKGRKIVFVVLPLTGSDSNFVKLRSFQEGYGDKIQIVGIPSFEMGFKRGEEANLRVLYQGRGLNFPISDGLQTQKAAGTDQSFLMRWLTHKDCNKHFDVDAGGVGQMFFVNEVGELYAVIGPEFAFSPSLMEELVNRSPRK